MPAFPLSVAANAATDLQFCPHALKLRLFQVLQLLRLSQLHHGISDHEAGGFPAQDALARTLLWWMMMKQYPSANGHQGLKQAKGSNSGRLALSPQALIFPPPLLADEGWQWKEDIRAWDDCHHVLSLMGFKCQKQNPPNPPQQDSHVPSFPCKQAPQQPTPGLSGTQWSEELFR
ncbi:hypothetical protein O181_095588, partial [Austropuccinia psidii MF-1]|nr:hypothetical protein [Austropuccinia psidii MF-1]